MWRGIRASWGGRRRHPRTPECGSPAPGDPKIKEHRGRIVKTTGLVEFPSVVDAVRCAAEVQSGMIDREPEATGERRIRFRIGVNVGDVIADGDDIFGDGVNVAARLEALAEPGGICISGTVRDDIRDKLPYPFEDFGEQSVKKHSDTDGSRGRAHRNLTAPRRTASVDRRAALYQSQQ